MLRLRQSSRPTTDSWVTPSAPVWRALRERQSWVRPIVRESTGAVYVFDGDSDGNWVQTMLTASDGLAGDQFGHSVAIDPSGKTIAVGAQHNEEHGPLSGAVYVFERIRANGPWVQTKLTPSDASEGDAFGASVALTDDFLIVGAAGDDDHAEESGSANIFERQEDCSRMEVKITVAEDVLWDADDRFGSSVDIFGDRAIVGAPHFGIGSGAAFIFERQVDGVWTPTRLSMPNGVWGLGQTVALDDGTAAVGQNLSNAPDAADEWTESNYLYEYQSEGIWNFTQIELPGIEFDSIRTQSRHVRWLHGDRQWRG